MVLTGEKPKYWEKNRSQSHVVHEKSHVDCPEIETGPLG